MEWIKCSEDLPDGGSKRETIWCLVFGKDYGILYRPFDTYHDCWNDEEDDDYECDSVGGWITHWMPLPEPPDVEINQNQP